MSTHAERCRRDLAHAMHHVMTGAPSMYVAPGCSRKALIADACMALVWYADLASELELLASRGDAEVQP